MLYIDDLISFVEKLINFSQSRREYPEIIHSAVQKQAFSTFFDSIAFKTALIISFFLKPENDFAKGGITIINKYTDIHRWINEKPKYKRWVLQKYIINPLLIDKKKFHFPENSLIAIITQSKPREVYRYIKLKPNMIYIYP